jgi:nucleotidyltransferase/DNA polymerase involved in DNA repair
MSLDEAYLDVTSLVHGVGSDSISTGAACRVTPTSIANEIRERVFQSTGLTCSVGAAANKLIAKVCRCVDAQQTQNFLLLFTDAFPLRFAACFQMILIRSAAM